MKFPRSISLLYLILRIGLTYQQGFENIHCEERKDENVTIITIEYFIPPSLGMYMNVTCSVLSPRGWSGIQKVRLLKKIDGEWKPFAHVSSNERKEPILDQEARTQGLTEQNFGLSYNINTSIYNLTMRVSQPPCVHFIVPYRCEVQVLDFPFQFISTTQGNACYSYEADAGISDKITMEVSPDDEEYTEGDTVTFKCSLIGTLKQGSFLNIVWQVASCSNPNVFEKIEDLPVVDHYQNLTRDNWGYCRATTNSEVSLTISHPNDQVRCISFDKNRQNTYVTKLLMVKAKDSEITNANKLRMSVLPEADEYSVGDNVVFTCWLKIYTDKINGIAWQMATCKSPNVFKQVKLNPKIKKRKDPEDCALSWTSELNLTLSEYCQVKCFIDDTNGEISRIKKFTLKPVGTGPDEDETLSYLSILYIILAVVFGPSVLGILIMLLIWKIKRNKAASIKNKNVAASTCESNAEAEAAVTGSIQLEQSIVTDTEKSYVTSGYSTNKDTTSVSIKSTQGQSSNGVSQTSDIRWQIRLLLLLRRLLGLK